MHQVHGGFLTSVEGLEVVACGTVFRAQRLRLVRASGVCQCSLEAALFVLDAVQHLHEFLVHSGFLAFLRWIVFFDFLGVRFGGAALAGDFRRLIGGPADHACFQQADTLAVGYTLLVGFVLHWDEADRQGVESAVSQEGHHVAASLRVRDSGGDVQTVVTTFRSRDAADEFAVLVAELGVVNVIETAVGVEGLGSLPGVDDATEGYGDAFQCAAVAFLSSA